jgi:diguanylate cyclase (GGDEF)-like protein
MTLRRSHLLAALRSAPHESKAPDVDSNDPPAKTPRRGSETAHTRNEAASSRDASATARDDIADVRDQIADLRDHASATGHRPSPRADGPRPALDDAVSGHHLDERRDTGAATRDGAAAGNDRIADRRDEHATRRDQQARGRDEAAETRDQTARTVERQEAIATARASSRADTVAVDEGAACERRRSELSRLRAADERMAARVDREASARDRTASASERQDAGQDRLRAAAERSTAGVDRAASARERAASAVERHDASQDRAGAVNDRRETDRELDAASHDALTGTYTRGAGMTELERDLSRAARTGEPMTLAFVDVDDLRGTNDRGRHLAGDRLLRQVADSLRTHTRPHDVIIRYGGDEFVCGLTGLTLSDAADRLAKVNLALAAASERGSITVGIADLRAGESMPSLIQRADEALYDHKRQR